MLPLSATGGGRNATLIKCSGGAFLVRSADELMTMPNKARFDMFFLINPKQLISATRKRSISYNDIISCIMNGIIIEEYPDDYPFPSALILEIKDNNPLHVVAGMSDEYLWVITAYRPDKEKWENDYKKRKEI